MDQPLIPLDIGDEMVLTTFVNVANYSDFYSLVNAVNPFLFNQTTPFTVFGPLDIAFSDNVTATVLKRLEQAVWFRHLYNLVEHHFFNGTIDPMNYVTAQDITMLSTYPVQLQYIGGNLYIDGLQCDFTELTTLNGYVSLFVCVCYCCCYGYWLLLLECTIVVMIQMLMNMPFLFLFSLNTILHGFVFSTWWSWW